jgi:hypothetical protein
MDMINIVPAFSKNQFRKIQKDLEEEFEKDILKFLIKACKEAISIVWNKKGPSPYEDRTGNLNSSTGFVVHHKGKIVHTEFRESNNGTDKKTGLKIGVEVAKKNLLENDGWGVVIVVGMEYASWVQGIHNRDVIASASGELPTKLADSLHTLNSINYG